jgi:hypothetical protein
MTTLTIECHRGTVADPLEQSFRSVGGRQIFDICWPVIRVTISPLLITSMLQTSVRSRTTAVVLEILCVIWQKEGPQPQIITTCWRAPALRVSTGRACVWGQ